MLFIFRKNTPLIRTCAYFLPSSLCSSDTKIDTFRTSKDNPGDHSKVDIGKLYKIPSDVVWKELFQYGGWRPEFVEQCQTFRESCLMVRKPGLEIIHYLKNADYSSPINKYVLFGKDGTGKASIMSYVLHYAHVNGWLLVHVPNLKQWLTFPTEVTNSKVEPGMVDLNIEASKWLLHFRTQNHKLLTEKNILVQKDHEWNPLFSTRAGESLLNLVDFGMSNGNFASQVLGSLVEEIKGLSTSGKIRTLVGIHAYNHIFYPETRVKNEEHKYVPPKSISIVKSILDLTKPDWHNGAVVVVCAGKDTFFPKLNFSARQSLRRQKGSELPLHQLTQEGFEFLFPFIPIEVVPFSEYETKNMLEYYKERKWLQNVNGDNELMVLSGGNGLELLKICAPL